MKNAKAVSGKFHQRGERTGAFIELQQSGGKPAGVGSERDARALSSEFRGKSLVDTEEAEIQRQIAADPDDAELTDDQVKQRMTFGEAFPELAESIKRSRGRPAVENPKQPISLRLSQDVIEAFKATGKGWQTRIDEALRKATGL